MVGMILGPQFITETMSSGQNLTEKQKYNGKVETSNYVLWHAILDTALCLPLVLFFVERPKYFPSYAARIMNKDNEYSFKEEYKVLRKKYSYMFFVVNYALVHGVYAALGATINNIVRPFGYTA